MYNKYLYEKTTLIIEASLYFIQVDMFRCLLWHHQNKLHKESILRYTNCSYIVIMMVYFFVLMASLQVVFLIKKMQCYGCR